LKKDIFEESSVKRSILSTFDATKLRNAWNLPSLSI
jgi:hypothetical protein